MALLILAFILNIETATTVCSVSVSEGNRVIAFKEIDNGYTHAENLHVFIDETLKESGLNIKHLNAIAISKGPGSYTGLRIGTSAAKGLAYALNIPLLAIDTLQIMAAAALPLAEQATHLCPMLDARRMEVYTGIYDLQLKPVKAIEALIVDENRVNAFNIYNSICFFGNGMPKCRALLNNLSHATFIDNMVPSAQHMASLSFQKFAHSSFENLAYFEPFYLKDFLITGKQTKSLT